MNNILYTKKPPLLKGCLTLALMAVALMFGPVLLKPNAQASPGDKGQAQKPGASTPTATGAISGIVTDAATSAPLAGVNVTIWTSNSGSVTSATTDGATTTGINFALDVGGKNAGRLTDAGTGEPIANAVVIISNSSGGFVDSATTNDSGDYVNSSGLPTGSWFVRTFIIGQAYLNELYDNIPCPLTGCDVTTGTPAPVRGSVILFNEIGQQIGNTFSDNSGNYITRTGLPTGTYYVRTVNFDELVDAIYNNLTCSGCQASMGTPITVTNGQTTPAINFFLCPTFSLSEPGRLFGASGGDGSVIVTSLGGCGWAAVPNAAWIDITSPNPVLTGNGELSYLVRDNPGPAPRTGTITIANQVFTITQEGQSPPACAFAISPQFAVFNLPGGPGSITVTTQAGCAWQAESNSSWITLTSPCCSAGNGQVSYIVAPNTTGSARNGVITIAGKKFNVKQK